MDQLKQFEDLDVWQTAKKVAIDVYRIARNGSLAKDYGFRDQLQRAAVSVMANIAEGHERGGKREYILFLRIAKGSAAEVRALIHVGRDLGYFSDSQGGTLLQEQLGIARQLGGFIRYLEKVSNGSSVRRPVS